MNSSRDIALSDIWYFSKIILSLEGNLKKIIEQKEGFGELSKREQQYVRKALKKVARSYKYLSFLFAPSSRGF